MRSRLIAPLVILAASGIAGAAHAEQLPLQGVVSLSASATVEVTKDLLNVVLSTTREGQDAATVQTQLKQALDAALAEARRQAKPGQIDIQTGNFSLYPRYAPKGGINGWQGTAELVIEGKDLAGIGAHPMCVPCECKCVTTAVLPASYKALICTIEAEAWLRENTEQWDLAIASGPGR